MNRKVHEAKEITEIADQFSKRADGDGGINLGDGLIPYHLIAEILYQAAADRATLRYITTPNCAMCGNVCRNKLVGKNDPCSQYIDQKGIVYKNRISSIVEAVREECARIGDPSMDSFYDSVLRIAKGE